MSASPPQVPLTHSVTQSVVELRTEAGCALENKVERAAAGAPPLLLLALLPSSLFSAPA